MTEKPAETDYFVKLLELMETLRGPNGCPWDLEQTRETLKPMLIEEAYEVLEALDGSDPDLLCEELGDLLFQIVFHSQIGKERGEFDAQKVCRRVYEKMVHRHPHVFGEAVIDSSEELLRNWEDLKKAEKERTGRKCEKQSLLDGLPKDLPTIYRTFRLTEKAARVGFDWPALEGIRDKILEEFTELQEAIASGSEAAIKEEVGDLVFAALNVARYLEVDPETALRNANDKFTRRFQAMEKSFQQQGRPLKDVSIEEMETVWQNQKNQEEGSKA